jgi:hypothetical protein
VSFHPGFPGDYNYSDGDIIPAATLPPFEEMSEGGIVMPIASLMIGNSEVTKSKIASGERPVFDILLSLTYSDKKRSNDLSRV